MTYRYSNHNPYFYENYSTTKWEQNMISIQGHMYKFEFIYLLLFFLLFVDFTIHIVVEQSGCNNVSFETKMAICGIAYKSNIEEYQNRRSL